MSTSAAPAPTKSLPARAGFALVTASLLLAEIALTRVFSGTIGYYFAFMSISVAMLGLGAGSLWVTLRDVALHPDARAGRAAVGLGVTAVAATLLYLRFYPAMGAPGATSQLAYVGLFAALFVPFLLGGVVISVVFEAGRAEFGKLYAIDLLGAAAGCVVAAPLLDRVPAPKAMIVIGALAALAGPLFLLGAGARRQAAVAAAALVVGFGGAYAGLSGSELFACKVIRNAPLTDLVHDEWNDFSRVIVKKGNFYTWGLSQRYEKAHDKQYDLLIEGVAGTQIQKYDGQHIKELDFFEWDISSMPHVLRPRGSTLVLGVGAGFDVMMAKYFDKSPIVGVEVNPLVGKTVNETFGAYSGRPYLQPGVTIHYENARTYVKRDKARYDIVTVTWVDSGAATGAGAFALTENYLYTVDAFRDYIARLSDDGVLAFMRARYSPDYDAIKGIGIAVEALRSLGVKDPERCVVVSSVKSPHFGWRELTHVMVKTKPFTPEELAKVDELRGRLWFGNLYTPGRADNDAPITRLVVDRDREAVYASFPFDMEPNHDDRPFYFFLRAGQGRPAGNDVLILRQAMVTLFVLIAAFLVVPLARLLKKGALSPAEIAAPSAYFSLLGLGFMLVEMKLLQQSVLVVGNPTLSLAAVLAALLVSTGLGALYANRLAKAPDVRRRAASAFGALLVVLTIALVTAEPIANALTGFELPVRTLGLVVAIFPMGFLLGCPLPLGMSTLGDKKGLVAWSWGMNGMLGVAGTAVATYVAIHLGLRAAFVLGMACYVVAGALFLGVLSRPRASVG
ncbi:MAG: hypothetical protein IT374_24690 [Polyangiaceae bacterium]|nr:hypothetical protein [Polyangiaceae bacterium]